MRTAAACGTSSAARWTWWGPSACCSARIPLSFRVAGTRPIFEEQARALYEIGLSAADARAIFGENLLRILAPSKNVM